MTDSYLDYNAGAPLRIEAARAMSLSARLEVGNPSSIHRRGHRARVLVESARESVAALLGASPGEIVFTSGGTEANNLAILGLARKRGGGHLIVSAAEHSSVLGPARQLEGERYRVSWIRPDGEGVVDPGAVLAEVRDDTLLVSLAHSNNEVGTLQPVGRLAGELHRRGVILHTDAVQSAGKVPLTPGELGVDLLSLSAHKIGGPPGVGCLWVRRGVSLEPLLRGGGQEDNRRAGTEPVPLIAGFGAAAEVARAELAREAARIGALRDRLEADLERGIPEVRFHGRGRPRLPNTISLAVAGCPGEEMAMALDLEGIAVSTGSACAAGTVRPSHVLAAMGCPEAESRSTLRISLGWASTQEDLLRLMAVLPEMVARIREATDGAAARGRGAAPGRIA